MIIARSILERLAGEPLPEWSAVESVIRARELSTGDYVFRSGESHPFVHFVGQGLIKLVYETYDGSAWIKAFAEEGRFFASLAALSPGGRASFSALAVGPTEIEAVPYRVLQELGDRHTSWQRTLRRAFEIYGFRKEERERDLLTLSAEERYKRFIRDCPHIATRIRDKDVAAYIRVTPVALSRIKARMRRNGDTPVPDSSRRPAATGNGWDTLATATVSWVPAKERTHK
ncbi:MAG: Crp/Fnr family transcriptional regulator [Ectothiorhodospiraceae bacterium]|nr:Crp/Fnr family transcriptional regulator [Ectothiorhodospiraceae bacterium]